MHVVILDLETGVQTEMEEPYEQAEWPPFYWTEGNDACDCNRGRLMGNPDVPCGQTRFAVQLTDGARTYDDRGRTKARRG